MATEGMTTRNSMSSPGAPNFDSDPRVMEAVGRLARIASYGSTRIAGFAQLIATGRFPETPESLAKLATCLMLSGITISDLRVMVRNHAIESHDLAAAARAGVQRSDGAPRPGSDVPTAIRV